MSKLIEAAYLFILFAALLLVGFSMHQRPRIVDDPPTPREQPTTGCRCDPCECCDEDGIKKKKPAVYERAVPVEIRE